MLNRRHIRVKVMQALYSYYNSKDDGISLQNLNKATDKSIAQLYELYLYLLLFLEELAGFVTIYEEEVKSRYIQNEKELRASASLTSNPALQQIVNSESIHKALENAKVIWKEDTDLLRKVFLDLKNQENYKEYVQFHETNPMLNYEILTFILKHYSTHFPLFNQHLEEAYINWHDDKKIALQMAVKTIQNMVNEGKDDEILLPLSQNDEENYEFAHELLANCVNHDARIDEIISKKVLKWEPHQLAFLDTIILKMAVCEFLYFPTIPTRVTINEYIELAKLYSTPQSKKFVNGVLDTIQKELKKDGIILSNK